MSPDPWRHRVRRLLDLPALASFAAGAASVTAFAPYDLYLVPLASLALLFRLWLAASPARAFRLGWWFGLGLMGFGVFWVRISIDQFGNVGTPLAVAAALGFVAVLALFPGLAGWLGRSLGRGTTAPLLLGFPAAWVLAEWLRGWVLTGFPWLALGYSQVDGPLAGYVPVGGVYAASWLLALSAGLLALLTTRPSRWPLWVAGGVMLWAVGPLLKQQSWTSPVGVPLQAALVQANIPQVLKWERSMLRPTLETFTGLTRRHWGKDLIVWPETAVPDFLHRVEQDVLWPLAEEGARHGTHLLAGVPVLDLGSGLYYNAMAVLGPGGDRYYKRHLVPFGEFLPLKPLLGPVLDFMEIPMSNFAAGTAVRPIIQVGGLPVGASICYEDAFGTETVQALPEAAYLVNLSNDAWFGDSLAPHQHLQIARARALETGRSLLRATNTGISAIIGPRGEVLAASGLFEQTVVTGAIQPMTGSTPFIRVGNGAMVLLVLLALAGCLAAGVDVRGRGRRDYP